VIPAARSVAALGGGAVVAVGFLTCLPVRRFAAADHQAVARAAPFYPLVGAGLWGTAGLLAWGLSGLLPPLLAATLVLASVALATGAMHLDALADSADALGGWSHEERLRIMRDHAVGSYGATALVVVCLVEVAALASIVERGTIALLVAVGAASRGIAPPLAAVLPRARAPEENVSGAISLACAVAAIAIAAAASAVAGLDGLVVFTVAVGVGGALGLFYRRWLGGVTGDTLGTAVQLAEAAGLVAAVALL